MIRSRALALAVAAAVLATPLATATADSHAPRGAATETPEPGDPASPSADPSADTGATPDATTNTAPVAVDDTATVQAGQSVTVEVLANDEDATCPSGEPPCLSVVSTSGYPEQVTSTEQTVTFASRPGDAGDVVIGYVAGDGELTDEATLTITVLAAAQRTVTLSAPTGMVALERYTFRGRVQPADAGRPEVTVQRRTPQGWTRVARARADDQGRWSAPFRTDRAGTRVLRAVAEWSTGQRARSDTVRRTVRAVADPVVSGPLTASAVPHSWRPGCPVPPSSLRRIRINRLDYTGAIARGAVIVRAAEASDIARVLTASLEQRFPIRSLRPADHFYAGGRRTPVESDKASMRAGNTSAFNCRPVVGNPYRISQHSYGNAIDINTIENPYVTGSAVYPAGSREYLDRSPYRRGMILGGGVVAERMRSLGWLWGARWSHPDYQHFSSNGG